MGKTLFVGCLFFLLTIGLLPAYSSDAIVPQGQTIAGSARANPSETANLQSVKLDLLDSEDQQGENQGEEDRVWFGVSASLNVFSLDLSTRKYSVGVSPGIGYGIRWSPAWWKVTDTFLGLDFFLNGQLVNIDTTDEFDYFKLSLTPVVTLVDAVSAGIGLSYEFSLRPSIYPDTIAAVFTFGLATSWGSSVPENRTDADANKRIALKKPKETRLKKDYLSVGTGLSVLFPMDVYGDFLDVGYFPVAEVLYNMSFDPLVFGFGILSGLSYNATKPAEYFSYDLLGIPVGASVTLETNWASPIAAFIDESAGAMVNMINYTQTYSGATNGTTTRFFTSTSLGGGFYFSPQFALKVFGNILFVFFPQSVYFAISPGAKIEINF
jgi:hypothetical protein